MYFVNASVRLKFSSSVGTRAAARSLSDTGAAFDRPPATGVAFSVLVSVTVAGARVIVLVGQSAFTTVAGGQTLVVASRRSPRLVADIPNRIVVIRTRPKPAADNIRGFSIFEVVEGFKGRGMYLFESFEKDSGQKS